MLSAVTFYSKYTRALTFENLHAETIGRSSKDCACGLAGCGLFRRERCRVQGGGETAAGSSGCRVLRQPGTRCVHICFDAFVRPGGGSVRLRDRRGGERAYTAFVYTHARARTLTHPRTHRGSGSVGSAGGHRLPRPRGPAAEGQVQHLFPRTLSQKYSTWWLCMLNEM